MNVAYRGRGSNVLYATLFWLLVPVWMLWLVLAWRQGSEGEPTGIVLTAYPETADAYPEVIGSLIVQFIPPGSGPARGDRLIRYGDADLRGLGPLPAAVREEQACSVTAAGFFEAPLTFSRSGVEHRTTVQFLCNRLVRWFVFMTLIEGLLAILVRLRAPDSAAARSFSVATMLHAILYSQVTAESDSVMYTAVLVGGLSALALLGPLALRCVLLVPEETAPKTRWPYWAVWGAALPSLPYWQYWFGWRLWDPKLITTEFTWAATWLTYAGLCFLGFALLVRNYLKAGSIGRRQLRWALFAMAIAVPALIAAVGISGIRPDLILFTLPLHLLTLLVPVAVAIAIMWFNLFDIDQLISSTTAFAASLSLLLVLGLLATPYVTGVLGTVFGADPVTSEVVLAIALVAVALPAQRYVRPVVERLFFRERFALEQGITQLLHDLGACDASHALLARAGETLDALLSPDMCVVYGRTERGYVAAFVRGRAEAPAFEATDPLVAALIRGPGAVIRERWVDKHGRVGLTPFDRAALDTVGGTVVVPAQRGDLWAFICLGAKRSGDVYTSTDLTFLAAVGDKIASELLRLETTARPHPVIAPAAAASSANGEGGGGPLAPEPNPRVNDCLFRNEGGYWTIAFNGSVVRLKDTKGLHYLARLLRHPGQEFLALDLFREGAGGEVAPVPNGDLGPLLDAPAKQAYGERLQELRRELEDAHRLNDRGRAERVLAEIEFIAQQLSAAVGLHGGDRKIASVAERARQTVTKRIRNALKTIGTIHPPLAHHLTACVKTGNYCSYTPPPDQSIEWEL